MSKRTDRVSSLIHQELGTIIIRDIEAPRGAITTINRVTVSPTLEHATVYISILPVEQEEEVMKKLKHQIYEIQQALNKRVAARPVPKIRFEIDRSGENLLRIEELLENDINIEE